MPSAPHFKRIVFCDFDGTITVEETFVALLKQFAHLSYDAVERAIVAGTLSIRDGVRQLVESIPSERYPEMLEFVRPKAIRPGFTELLDFLHSRAVPFIVISGGLRGLVLARLAGHLARIHTVYAADVSTSGPCLKVISAFEGGGELVAKAEIMTRYRCDESVAIGDGMTDITMARRASLTFARNGLCNHLARSRTPFEVWEDFHEIREHLGRRWTNEKEENFSEGKSSD